MRQPRRNLPPDLLHRRRVAAFSFDQPDTRPAVPATINRQRGSGYVQRPPAHLTLARAHLFSILPHSLRGGVVRGSSAPSDQRHGSTDAGDCLCQSFPADIFDICVSLAVALPTLVKATADNRLKAAAAAVRREFECIVFVVHHHVFMMPRSGTGWLGNARHHLPAGRA